MGCRWANLEHTRGIEKALQLCKLFHFWLKCSPCTFKFKPNRLDWSEEDPAALLPPVPRQKPPYQGGFCAFPLHARESPYRPEAVGAFCVWQAAGCARSPGAAAARRPPPMTAAMTSLEAHHRRRTAFSQYLLGSAIPNLPGEERGHWVDWRDYLLHRRRGRPWF